MQLRSVTKRVAERAVGPLGLDESQVAHSLLKDSYSRVMLDVGAHVGYSLLPFARDGWTVHAFEPDPTNRAGLEKHLAAEPTLDVRVVPKAVSNEPGSLQLFTSPESTGISSLAPFTATHEATAEVEVIRLDGYLAEHGIDSVGFMKIDVEGFERHVLAGYDWAVKPEVIVLEFEDTKTLPLGYGWTELADELVGHGYSVTVSEWAPIERYGVEHTWLRFEPYPTTLLNEEGWGNLIAQLNPHPHTERILSSAARRYRFGRRLS